MPLRLGGRGSVLRKGGEYSDICFSNGMKVPWESEDWIWQEGSSGRRVRVGEDRTGWK